MYIRMVHMYIPHCVRIHPMLWRFGQVSHRYGRTHFPGYDMLVNEQIRLITRIYIFCHVWLIHERSWMDEWIRRSGTGTGV
jgi:hypothetical protein